MFRNLIVTLFLLALMTSCKEEGLTAFKVPVKDEPNTASKLDSSLYVWEDDAIVVDWKDLLDVTFEKKTHELLDSVDIPVFNKKVLALNGQKVIVEGFYIPVEETGDENIVILSAFPYAECFFCGQAGVESIVDVLIKEKLPHLKTDAKVRFSGKFKTNPDNFDFLIYILEDAKFLPVK